MSQKKRPKFDVEWMSVDEINPADYNPRAITQDAKQGLSNSIEKWKLLIPLVVNIRGGENVLISGHRRLEDLISKGFEEVPVIKKDLSQAEEKALNATMNNKYIEGFFTEDIDLLIAEVRAELGDTYIGELRLNCLESSNDWNSDIEAIDKIEENLDGIPGKIVITCKQEEKDEVLIYLKEKLMETSFEGVHIE